ncbi:amino acid adenylation domain-containing protein [Acinetobacter venetianus]|uniref:amino acid adenylation domain-containing protein n=1 Tax=Acinetobacter venetianus TaxID=52133 RepID=UPI0035BE1A5F
MNGADIYQKLCTSLQGVISDTLLHLSNELLNKDQSKSSSTLPQFEELDLNTLIYWHHSNQTKIEHLYIKNLYQAFEHTADLHPVATAIKYGHEIISYADLKEKITRYASNIKALIGSSSRQQIIAIALPKSIELYSVILASLKLKACYVPIDPEYPEERVRNILKSAKPDLLVGSLTFESTVKATPIASLEAETNNSLVIETSENSESSAVMIYTSGSTGTPKGVQLTHNNISHFCDWYINEAQISTRSKCLQFTTISFDASLLDIFPTLIAGATLIVPSNEQRHDFDQLDKLIRYENVSHCFIPPAMLSALPQYDWPSMQYIITGGDVCDNTAIKYWSKHTNLINIYGPTECTVLATFKKFTPESNNKIIGKPINNVQIYLINEHGKPCQTLEHGELYISGKGVGLGYTNDHAQTKERFVKLKDLNIFKTMYRTGDICFWDVNGEINFVGRQDNQLKIRGFRVEIGEIENTILNTGLYDGCIVITDSKKQIRAFVKNPVNGVTTETLREKLLTILPNYMLPAAIIELEEFPYTINGKVDRKALAAINISSVNRDNEEWTKLQAELRSIWATTLDLDLNEISLKSSFFDLGGHSLLVSKMLLIVKKTFKGSFTLARFMENPTIEALSNLLTYTELSKGAQISDRIYADVVLDQNIQPLKTRNTFAFTPRSVLLTGATGFLGMHIIEQLIQLTDATIYCHVRSSSPDVAIQKLEENFKRFGIKNLNGNTRIKIICGDLTEPKLGLSETDYQMLSENIDTIYHNGAQVNHIYDYEYLYNANVRSTVDLIQLASTGIQKQLVFVSTLSAASNVNEDGHIVEDGPADELPTFVNNGYNLTKWASEQLVWQAYERGLPVTLVRPGNITGHSHTGHCFPDQNRILLLLKGSAQLGVAPDWDLQFDLCPVDFIAKGIVEGSLDQSKHTPVLHFHNPKPLTWKEYIGRLNHHGISIEFIRDKDWREMLLTIDESNALFQVVSFYLDETSEDIGDISKIEFEKTLNRLKLSGMDYPDKNHQLLDANLGFLISSGFIEKPQLKNNPVSQQHSSKENYMSYSEKRTTLIQLPTTKTVSTAVTINGSAAEVWDIVGNFTRFDKFVNGLERIEMSGEGIRAVRHKFFADGNIVLEQLNSRDDEKMLMDWTLIFTSMDIGNLWSSMRVNKIDENTSVAIWDIAAEPWNKETKQKDFEKFLAGFAAEALNNVKQMIENKKAA